MNERGLTRTMLITIGLVLCLVVILGIIGIGMVLNYVLMEHYVHTISLHIESIDRATTQHILSVQQRAATGRSRELCRSLRELARTRAAHKLHPVFVNVYKATSCSQVTGKLHVPTHFSFIHHHHHHH